MLLVVTLTIRPGALEAFRDFETRAAAIMAKHGGAIERAIYVPPAREGESAREVHIVSFPDEASFAAYRADEALTALAPLRSAAIAQTEVLVGEAGPEYRYAGVS